jgi:hypothetical protein
MRLKLQSVGRGWRPECRTGLHRKIAVLSIFLSESQPLEQSFFESPEFRQGLHHFGINISGNSLSGPPKNDFERMLEGTTWMTAVRSQDSPGGSNPPRLARVAPGNRNYPGGLSGKPGASLPNLVVQLYLQGCISEAVPVASSSSASPFSKAPNVSRGLHHWRYTSRHLFVGASEKRF